MYVTRIDFKRTDLSSNGREAWIDEIQAVLGAWRMNGQVCGREWHVLDEAGGYSTVLLCPERESLEARFNSSHAATAIARAEGVGLQLACQDLGEDADSASACSCHSPSSYALFTTYLSLESPVRCMDCWRPVPLYRLKPMASGEFHELITWQSDYQSCDGLQMNCRVLERATTREISHLASALTADGRTHCAALAAMAARPFYYYLYRGHGRSRRTELARLCPSCGGKWHLASPLHSLFDFKCDRCHLLSHVAFDVRK